MAKLCSSVLRKVELASSEIRCRAEEISSKVLKIQLEIFFIAHCKM